jgi:hypothetical protein
MLDQSQLTPRLAQLFARVEILERAGQLEPAECELVDSNRRNKPCPTH